MSPSRLPSRGCWKNVVREDDVAARREDEIDRVVHAAGHHRFDAAAVRPRAEDVRRPAW